MANLPLPKPTPPAAVKPSAMPSVGNGSMMPAGGAIRSVVSPQPIKTPVAATPSVVLPPSTTGGVGAVSPVRPVGVAPTSTSTPPSNPIPNPPPTSAPPSPPSTSTVQPVVPLRPQPTQTPPTPSVTPQSAPTTAQSPKTFAPPAAKSGGLSVAPPIPVSSTPKVAPVISPLPVAPLAPPPPQTPTTMSPPLSGGPLANRAVSPAPTTPPSVAPTPTAPTGFPTVAPPTVGGAPVSAPRPPQTVTALSSVSANKLPKGAGAPPPPPPSAAATAQNVEYAKPKGSIFKFLPFLIGGLLVLLVAVFGVMWFLNRNAGDTAATPKSNSGSNSAGTSGTSGTSGTGGTSTGQQVVLQYWGLWEPSETMQQVIADFQKTNPGVSVQYVKQSHKDYRTRLQNALNSGNGPDLFRFHASWVPMLKTELAPLPSAVMSSADFLKTFYPVAASQLQVNGTPVGIPLMYEGLALFYNVDILNTAVVQPPKTWSETQEAARKLTVMENGVVKRAGIAMGNATNVEHFSDIIALLMLQNGADFSKPNSPETRDALLFYTKFAKDNVWDESLPNSSVAFARGDVAMIFAPSWRAHEIKQMNPSLNFATTSVPQLSGDEKITWANYWAEGVGVKGKHQKEAWAFLKYLSSKEVQQKMYAEQAKTRSFGEIYSRVDAADSLATDKVVGSFVIDAPKATGWYMSGYTHDGGINDEIIQYYANAVGAMLTSTSVDDILKTLDSGVKQVLQKYGVTKAPASGQST